MDDVRILEDLEKTLNIIHYRYQPDVHGYDVSSSYEGTATVTSRRYNHGSPSTDAVEKKLVEKLRIMSMPKSRRKAELMIKNASAHRFKNKRNFGEGWTLSQKDNAWSFVMYTLRGALDRLTRLFDPRPTVGVGASIEYPRMFKTCPASEKVPNLRGRKPSQEEIDYAERCRQEMLATRKQLRLLCTHLYELIHSLDACQRGVRYWTRFGGDVNTIQFLEYTIVYLQQVCIDIHSSCPQKIQNVKRVERKNETNLCRKLHTYWRDGDLFKKVILRLLRSRTRLPETRALYLHHVEQSNSLLRLLS